MELLRRSFLRARRKDQALRQWLQARYQLACRIPSQTWVQAYDVPFHPVRKAPYAGSARLSHALQMIVSAQEQGVLVAQCPRRLPRVLLRPERASQREYGDRECAHYARLHARLTAQHPELYS